MKEMPQEAWINSDTLRTNFLYNMHLSKHIISLFLQRVDFWIYGQNFIFFSDIFLNFTISSWYLHYNNGNGSRKMKNAPQARVRTRIFVMGSRYVDHQHICYQDHGMFIILLQIIAFAWIKLHKKQIIAYWHNITSDPNRTMNSLKYL